MSSSQNEAGIAINTTEVGKRITRNSRGLIPKQLFPDDAKAPVPHENTSSKPNTNHYNTCFGRFSTTDRQAKLLAGSPHSDVKLKRLGIDLSSNTAAENETNKENGATPSSPRQTIDILKLEIDGSPVRIQIKRRPPSPYARSYYPNPRQPSPRTVAKAQKIHAPQNAEKICEAVIRLNSFKKGQKTSRAIPYSEFNGISAQILNTLYGSIVHIRIRKEYLHGIDKSAGGKANQKNIFVASLDANSQMIPLDDAKRRLLEEGLCQQIQTVVKSTLQTKADSSALTHIAEEIEITYHVDNTGLKIYAVIDANTTERPSVKERKMIIDFLLLVQKALLAQQAEMQTMTPANTPDSKEELSSREDPSLSDTATAHFEESLVSDSLLEDMLFNDDPLDCSVEIDTLPDGHKTSTVFSTVPSEHSDLLEEFSSYRDLLCRPAEFKGYKDALPDSADRDHCSRPLYDSVDRDSEYPSETVLIKKSQPFERITHEVNENARPNTRSNHSFFSRSSPPKKRFKPMFEFDKIDQVNASKYGACKNPPSQ